MKLHSSSQKSSPMSGASLLFLVATAQLLGTASAAPSPNAAAAVANNRFLDYIPTNLRLFISGAVSAQYDPDYDVVVVDENCGFEQDAGFGISSNHTTCPIDTPTSCSRDGGSTDTCCYEATNGLFLVTQFWDYAPATGPADLFTTHGLWSNKCAGGYLQFCNKDWEIDNATEVLASLGRFQLLEEMHRTWKDITGRDEDLWEHEFNKHATCMATINPSKCYSKDAPKYQYVGDFYETVVHLQAEVPTYRFLEQSGIVPTHDKQYSKAEILQAITQNGHGHAPRLGCTNGGALQEVWYYYHLHGSVVDGEYVPIDTPTSHTCPDSIWYYPKDGKTTPNPGEPGDSNSGYLKLSDQPGCLISDGKWFTSGTCATFHKKPAQFGGVAITSSKGNCDVVNGELSCAKANQLAQFTEDSDGNLVYGGESKWSASKVPSSNEQVGVSPGTKGPVTFTIKLVGK